MKVLPGYQREGPVPSQALSPACGFSTGPTGSRNHRQESVSTPRPLEGSRERQKEKEFVHSFALIDMEAEAKSQGQPKR